MDVLLVVDKAYFRIKSNALCLKRRKSRIRPFAEVVSIKSILPLKMCHLGKQTHICYPIMIQYFDEIQKTSTALNDRLTSTEAQHVAQGFT